MMKQFTAALTSASVIVETILKGPIILNVKQLTFLNCRPHLSASTITPSFTNALPFSFYNKLEILPEMQYNPPSIDCLTAIVQMDAQEPEQMQHLVWSNCPDGCTISHSHHLEMFQKSINRFLSLQSSLKAKRKKI